MAIYKNISSSQTGETLVAKDITKNIAISKITITNHDLTDECRIKLYLDDGGGVDANNPYVLARTIIPPLVTLVLDDNVSFNRKERSLKIDTSSSADLTIIIK